MPMIDLLIRTSGKILTLSEPHHRPKRGKELLDLNIILGGFIGVDRDSGKITYVSSTPPDSSLLDSDLLEIDAGDRVVMPAFIDCHNHLIWAGSRAEEFVARCQGATYQEILASGGGIFYTREKTMRASDHELLETAKKNLTELVRNGVTSLEAKNGYALTPEGELRLLYLISMLSREFVGKIVATHLVHAVPPERRSERSSYIEDCLSLLPIISLQELARFVDVFVDENALHLAEAERILSEAKKLGFALRVHADQFRDDGASSLALKLGARTIDHADFVSDSVISSLASSDTICVLLPGSNFFTKQSHYPQARRLIDAGAVVALATDLNPGSSHIFSPPFIMSLACLNLGMRVEEAISAFTKNSAFALDLGYTKGTITPGSDADIIILATEDFNDLAYAIGAEIIDTVICRGKIIKERGVLSSAIFVAKGWPNY